MFNALHSTRFGNTRLIACRPAHRLILQCSLAQEFIVYICVSTIKKVLILLLEIFDGCKTTKIIHLHATQFLEWHISLLQKITKKICTMVATRRWGLSTTTWTRDLDANGASHVLSCRSSLTHYKDHIGALDQCSTSRTLDEDHSTRGLCHNYCSRLGARIIPPPNQTRENNVAKKKIYVLKLFRPENIPRV